MSRPIKHFGFGKWFVVDEDGNKIAGPFDKVGAGEEAKKEAAPSPDVVNEAARERAYLERMNADLKRPITEELDEIKAVLAKRRDPDTVELLVRTIEPILIAGREGARRERQRYRHIVPARAAIAA